MRRLHFPGKVHVIGGHAICQSHGDGYPFDDAGGADSNTLAHAFFPPPAGGQWAGSLHFDEFEFWKDQAGGSGIRLYSVALHQIGHLLGLAHSQDQNAIMYAYYADNRNDLRADDIAGVQSLYVAALDQPTGGLKVEVRLPVAMSRAAEGGQFSQPKGNQP